MSDNGKLLRKDLPEVKTPFISDSTYDFFRNNVELVLPALGAFYSGMSLLWGWPYSEQIVGSLGLLTVFLGVLIKVNKSRSNNVQAVVEAEKQATRYAGDLIVGTGDEALGLATLALDKDVDELAEKDEITLRVKRISLPD